MGVDARRAPDHLCDDAHDIAIVFFLQRDCLIVLVLWHQPRLPIRVDAKALNKILTVDHCHNDVSIVEPIRFVRQHSVAIDDACILHGVALCTGHKPIHLVYHVLRQRLIAHYQIANQCRITAAHGNIVEGYGRVTPLGIQAMFFQHGKRFFSR